MKAAILTDFGSHDAAYSLCGVVANQVKMLRDDNDLTVFVRGNPKDFEKVYERARVVQLDPGEIGNNVVNVTAKSEEEIAHLHAQFETNFADIDVVLTHDLIYQPNMWKYHVAARRFAVKHPKTKWLHWIHSATNLGTINAAGRFKQELTNRFPHSWLVAMNDEEINRKAGPLGFEREQVVVIPNPLDIMEFYDPITRAILGGKAWAADILIVYPARLDRGKQVEVVGEIAEQLNLAGWSTLVIVVDFHSTGGDKVNYRDELKERFGKFMGFTSDVPGCAYHVSHRVVMDLFDYADVFVHPSVSESDPLIVPEAMWKRNLMVLNFDLPVFRQYDGRALFGKFSSAIDVTSGEVGETKTTYTSRGEYMAHLARAVAHMVGQDPIAKNHRLVRQTRSLEACKTKYLMPAIDGIVEWMR